MALDIEIDNGSKEALHWISLEYSEYNVFVDIIKRRDNFRLLKKCFSKYFGEEEIYLNELNNLKDEVTKLGMIVEDENHSEVKDFIYNFLELIEIAINIQKTIKFIGD